MKVRSRILNVFLAIILVFTTVLSTNREVFAIKTPDVIETRNGEGNGIKEDKDGNYKLTKTIREWGDYRCRRWFCKINRVYKRESRYSIFSRYISLYGKRR